MKTQYRDEMPKDFTLNLYSFKGEDQASHRNQFKHYLTIKCGLHKDGRCSISHTAMSDVERSISLEDLRELRTYVAGFFENQIDMVKYPGMDFGQISLAKKAEWEAEEAERQKGRWREEEW